MSRLYDSQLGNCTLALTGDTMLSRRLTPFSEKGFLAIRSILRNADAAFTNLEATVRTPDEGVHDMSLGTLMTTPPELLGDLKWMGFGLVSTANNHAGDFGHGGVLATLRHLDAAGIVRSGSGRDLTEARKPAYLDTPAGRVALISATAFFSPWQRASEPGPEMPGRPGVNTLAWNTRYTVDRAAFEQLAIMSRELGLEQEQRRRSRGFFSAEEVGRSSEREIDFLGGKFAAADEFEAIHEADEAEAAANLKWVAEARRQADWVIFSLHCHACSERGARTAESNADLEELAGFARDFAHRAIEAGCDAVACHGPHISLGVEIFNGRPIFYSLGNFVFQNDTVTAVPRESYQRFGLGPDATPADFLDARTGGGAKGFPAHPEYWRSIFAVVHFRAHELAAVEILPLDLGYGLSRAQRGRPVLAEGAAAEEILSRTSRLSSFYGTEIATKNGLGRVAL